MDAPFPSGLVKLTLAVFLAFLLPDPANSAPLALRVHVPLDIRKPVIIFPRPTLPAKPQEQIMSVHKSGDNDNDNDSDDDDSDRDGDDGGGKTWRLKFRGLNLPREFGAYDLDHNRGVSLAELAEVTDTKLGDAREPFDAADTDRNQVLTQDEFTQAPWIFDAGGITLMDSAFEDAMEEA